MTTHIIHAPVRVDLAGGTLDIWPISAIIPNAVTLNVTLNDGVTVKIEQISGTGTLVNADTGVAGSITSTHPDLRLLAGAMHFFAPRADQGLKITVGSCVPRGAGLGTSSVILAAILFGLSQVLKMAMTPMEIVSSAADIEAALITAPTGIQDYIAPLFGGMNAIRFPAGTRTVTPIPILKELQDRMVLIFTGISHFSATPNWEMIKGFFDSSRIQQAFYRLADLANSAVTAASSGNINRLARYMREDYDIRKSLPVQLLPQTENLFQFLEKSPLVAGFRMCGAAGGGTVVAISTEGNAPRLRGKVHKLGYQILDLRPEKRGIRIESE